MRPARNTEILYKFWEIQEPDFTAKVHAVIPTIYGFQFKGVEFTPGMTSVEKSASKLYGCCGSCFKPWRKDEWVRYATRYMIGLKGEAICVRSNHTTVCGACCPESPFVCAGRANFRIFDRILQEQWRDTVELFGGKMALELLDHDWVPTFLGAIEQDVKIPDSVRRQDLSCDFCRREYKFRLRRCANCRTTHYCTKECQVAHWKFHKQACGWIKGRTWLMHRIKFHR